MFSSQTVYLCENQIYYKKMQTSQREWKKKREQQQWQEHTYVASKVMPMKNQAGQTDGKYIFLEEICVACA